MTTTTRMTPVMRMVSWRVGQTTLRSSNMDSEKKSLVWRPLAVSDITTAAATTPATATRAADRARPLAEPVEREEAGHDERGGQNVLGDIGGGNRLLCLIDLRVHQLLPGGGRLGAALPARRGKHLPVRDGTPGRTRTYNLRFWRPLLCQLSY